MDNNYQLTLAKNITKLLEERKITQSQLAELLCTTQPNVHKHLKNGTFSIPQIIKIADEFNLSVDELLGRKENNNLNSPLAICKMIESLRKNNNLLTVKYTKENEVIWDDSKIAEECPCTIEPERIETTYVALYFSNYDRIPGNLSQQESDMLFDEYEHVGNINYNNLKINNFLDKFHETYNNYESRLLSKEEYDVIVASYFKKLEKEEK